MVEFRGTDRFEVIRQMGAGGMGFVYEALDKERNARVALKTLKKLDADHLYLFKNEFRALTNISHENLVTLHELISDEEQDQWFFTMELIEGDLGFIRYLRGMTVLDLQPETPETSPTNPSPEPNLSTRALDVAVEATRSEVEHLGQVSSLASNPDATIDHGSKSDDDQASGETFVETAEAPPLPSQNRLDATEDWDATAGPNEPRTEAPVVKAGSTKQIHPTTKRQAPPTNYQRLRETISQITLGVMELHRNGKLHRDLKPANTIIRPDGTVVLLDFGLVADLSESAELEQNFSQLASRDDKLRVHSTDGRVMGTVPYMSPEQATAKPLSPASDFYSLGVMLYEALTGRRPFTGSGKKILHAKLTQNVPPPSLWFRGIPEDLDQLCADLLQIDPAKRPRGAEILSRLSGSVAVVDAGGDFDDGIKIPFVGRRTHLESMQAAFDSVRQGKAAVCHVHGVSGAGKSALVRHFLDEMVAGHDAIILSGRCYEQESVPFKAVDSLIDALTRYLMRVGKEKLGPLLPENTGALARVFPVLKRVPQIEAQTDEHAHAVDLRELRDLAFVALKELLARIASQRPLVLYIDDLQWGDVDSAALLNQLMAPPGAPTLLLLLTYRSEYIGNSDCLTALEEQSRGESLEARQEIVVGALSNHETLRLTELLIGEDQNDREHTSEHARWIVNESGGSAFLIYELVRYLKSGRDLTNVQGVHLDEIIWQRIMGLPEDSRRLLEVVAVSGQPVQLIHAQLATGLESLASRVTGRLRSEALVRSTGPTLHDDIETYHDRIRESVVDHLSQDVRAKWHLGLGESLLRSEQTQPDTLAYHFDRGGQPGRASQYYLAAADNAVEVLAFERAEALYQRAVELADSDVRKAAASEKLIHYYTDTARFDEAYEVGRQATALFGVRLPAKFVPPLLLADLALSKLRLGFRRIEGLLNLPTMDDEQRVWVVRIMSACAKAAYQIRPELCVAVSTKMVNQCLRFGNTPDCAIGYMAYGAIFHGGVLGFHKSGYRWGRLALDIVEKYENAYQRAEVNFVIGYFGTSWLQPATEAEQLWQKARQAGLEVYDFFHTGCACAATTMSYFMRGVPLDEVMEAAEEYNEFLQRAQLSEPLGAIRSVQQAVRNLRGKTRSEESWDDDDFDEASYVEALSSYGSSHLAHYYFINKLQTLYLWGRYDRAIEVMTKSQEYLPGSPGMLHAAEHHFYSALLLATTAHREPQRLPAGAKRTLRASHRKLRRWASRNEQNFRHKERLVAAEVARSKMDINPAIDAYRQAIQAASDYGYVHVEALANQLAAQFHSQLGHRDLAESHLDAAICCYRRWGALDYAVQIRLEETS